MWTFASFHAVSQSVFPVSLCKPPRKKKTYIFKGRKKKHSSCFGRLNSAERSLRGQEKKIKKENKLTETEPDVDLTPMHIPCISGDISKPQIYRKIDHVSEMCL